MKNFEPKAENIPKTDGQKLQEDFNRLQNIAEVLRGMGLRVIDRFITINSLQDPSSEMGFPIVRDRADGIRASYTKREGLIIWFTNGFEDLKDPKRQEVERRLKEAGLI